MTITTPFPAVTISPLLTTTDIILLFSPLLYASFFHDALPYSIARTLQMPFSARGVREREREGGERMKAGARCYVRIHFGEVSNKNQSSKVLMKKRRKFVEGVCSVRSIRLTPHSLLPPGF
jgi:hypothetical protein